MRVKLVQYIGDASKITFELKGDYVTLDPTLTLYEGVKYILTVKNGLFILIGAGETLTLQDPLVLVPRKYDNNHYINVNDRPYLGALEFQLEENHNIRPINQLPLEDYLKGVVPFEVFPAWGIETLKAQALAARTYAVSNLNANMDDTIKYQVYGGFTWMPATTKAVTETKGEVIIYKNKLIEAFYSASNGGVTESNANVWGGHPISYYPIKVDPYDPTHPWQYNIAQTQVQIEDINWDHDGWWEEIQEKNTIESEAMKRYLVRNGYPGDIKILSIPEFNISNERLDSNRVKHGSITIQFLQRIIDGTILFQQISLNDVEINKIRPIIGGNLFKSYYVDSLQKVNGIYNMKGKGYGHGVGMSQWGANIMGERGKTYKEILRFYFPGTSIKTIGTP